jgi:predicted transcriptional regulator
VQLLVNAPTARFQEYLEDLRQRGFLEAGALVVTARGEAFLQEYRKVRDFLERFGFGGDGPQG